MTDIEKQILDSLVELDQTVKAMRGGGAKVSLIPLFEKLDQLTACLPRGADPELAHFMMRKSYEKARLLLEGRGAENAAGSCGH